MVNLGCIRPGVQDYGSNNQAIGDMEHLKNEWVLTSAIASR